MTGRDQTLAVRSDARHENPSRRCGAGGKQRRVTLKSSRRLGLLGLEALSFSTPWALIVNGRRETDQKHFLIWLRRNVQYAQVELGYRELDAEFESSIVIGRRKDMPRSQKDRYRELSRDRIKVMTYDRFFERIASVVTLIGSKR